MQDDEGEKLNASGQAGELRDVTWSGNGKAQALTLKLSAQGQRSTGQAERLGSPLCCICSLYSHTRELICEVAARCCT